VSCVCVKADRVCVSQKASETVYIYAFDSFRIMICVRVCVWGGAGDWGVGGWSGLCAQANKCACVPDCICARAGLCTRAHVNVCVCQCVCEGACAGADYRPGKHY
jgi:hypothetical protein